MFDNSNLDGDVASLRSENAALRSALDDANQREGAFPAGHYYSPIPDRAMVRTAAELPLTRPDVAGVDINAQTQLRHLERFKAFAADLPFPVDPEPGCRYYYNNAFFGHGDAIALYSMMRLVQPARIFEVGSGFSSAVMLDVNERFFGGSIECTFVEPYPERLHELLRPEDRRTATIVDRPIQETDPAIFKALQRNDILFIDSSHVLKFGSDLAYIFWEVLPMLRPGVVIHFHDIFFPFEYPTGWLRDGRFWNECYLLRAFLTHNLAYSIELFNDFLRIHHPEALAAVTPLWVRNTGGSMWLKKIAD